MKMTPRTVVIAAATAAFSLSANAATTLINEDWESPVGASNGSFVDVRNTVSTVYPGWIFNGNGNVYQIRTNVGDGVPVNGTVMKMAWFNSADTAEYDTGHTWTTGDQFSLSLNATEQSWGSANQRFMTVSLVETVRNGSNVLTGTTVWSDTQELIRDEAHDAHPEGYGANATFSYNINTADFSGGTEDSELTFVIAGSGARGFNFDNVFLSATPVPEPSVTGLLGLCGLALVLRRRR